MSVSAPVRLACPHCKIRGRSGVLDTRGGLDGEYVRRRRRCEGCGHRYTTIEVHEGAVVRRKNLTGAVVEAIGILQRML